MNPILEAKSLNKSFLLAGVPQLILEDASMQLQDKEFLSIIGASGCGKSTFLELLAGITKPDRGSVIHQGKDITAQGGYLGYMPQDDLLFAWLSVFENALLPARIQNRDLAQAKKRLAELLPIFNLETHAQHLPWQLSGGLKQRTSLLRTVMTQASVLLLDEPFANLDAITRRQLQLWLKQISKELNAAIILVTHDITEALLLSDRVLLMKGPPGKFVAEYRLAEKADQENLQNLKRQILSALEL